MERDGGEARGPVRGRVHEVNRLWGAGKKAEALALAEEVHRDAPDRNVVAWFYCKLLFGAREWERTREVCAECLERFREPRFLGLMCAALIRAHRPEDVVALTPAWFDDPDIGSQALLCHGAAQVAATGVFDSGVAFFHRAAAIGGLKNDEWPARKALPNAAFAALSQTPDDATRNALTIMGGKPVARAMVLAGADEKYFRALSGIYIKTFFATNPDPAHVLHIHLYDPSEALLGETAAMANDRLRFSYEQTAGVNRSYYYAGRFVQLPRLMAHYDCPIIVTDIDCAFKSGVEEVLRASADSDIGLVEVERHICMWRNFLANMVVFNPTETGRRYAAMIQSFLRDAPVDVNYWYVDQLALVQCAYVNRNLGLGRIAPLAAERVRLLAQGTGDTGHPEMKAAAMRARLGEGDGDDDGDD